MPITVTLLQRVKYVLGDYCLRPRESIDVLTKLRWMSVAYLRLIPSGIPQISYLTLILLLIIMNHYIYFPFGLICYKTWIKCFLMTVIKYRKESRNWLWKTNANIISVPQCKQWHNTNTYNLTLLMFASKKNCGQSTEIKSIKKDLDISHLNCRD